MKTTGLIILFTVLISKLAFASEFFQGQSVANLLLDCDGVLSIEKVGDVKFTPERPPQGRFDGLPAHGSIQLYFKISQFNKVGCQ